MSQKGKRDGVISENIYIFKWGAFKNNMWDQVQLVYLQPNITMGKKNKNLLEQLYQCWDFTHDVSP